MSHTYVIKNRESEPITIHRPNGEVIVLDAGESVLFYSDHGDLSPFQDGTNYWLTPEFLEHAFLQGERAEPVKWKNEGF